MQLIIIFIFSFSLVRVSVNMKHLGVIIIENALRYKKKTMYEGIIPFTYYMNVCE